MTSVDPMPNRKGHLVLLAAIILLFLIHAAYLNCVAEDSFIAFRYARNLASGHGLTWNVGQLPVEGYTNYLWVLLLAFATVLHLNVPLFSQFVGIAAGVAVIIYTFRFAHDILHQRTIHSLIPCVLLAVSGPFATWAGSGMETTLFALLVLIGCFYFARHQTSHQPSHLLVSSVAMFLATLTRPEGLMCFAILIALYFVLAEGGFRASLSRLLPALLIFIVPFSAHVLWRVSYFGYLLPNTFYAKTGGTWYQFLRGAMYTGYFFVYFILPYLFLVVLLVWERSNRLGEPSGRLPLRATLRKYFGIMICISLVVVYTLYIVAVGGDYMAMFRFFVPLLPLIYLLIGSATSSLFTVVYQSLTKRILAIGLLLFAIATTIFQSTPAERIILHAPLFQHGQYQGVQTERWHSARLTLIGRFFHDYSNADNESLATDAIGAIGYYSDMIIYDINGIVDVHIAHSTPNEERIGWGLPAHEKSDLRYTFSLKPTFFMFSRDLSPEPLPYPTFNDENEAELDTYVRAKYSVTSVWLIDPKNHEEGYFSFLEMRNREVSD